MSSPRDDDPTHWVNVAQLSSQLSAVHVHEVEAPSPAALAGLSTPRRAGKGSTGTWGVGDAVKPARLVKVTGDEQCLHFIGSTRSRVCLKEKKPGEEDCGIKHRGGKMEVLEPTLLV